MPKNKGLGSDLLISNRNEKTKRVAMKKAANGFVITSFDDSTGKETTKIAKTKPEAKKIASKFLG